METRISGFIKFTAISIWRYMEAPTNYFDKTIDVYTHQKRIAKTYLKAISISGVTKIIHGSYKRLTNQENGMLYEIQQILKELPSSVSLKEMRPLGCYYNIFIHQLLYQF